MEQDNRCSWFNNLRNGIISIGLKGKPSKDLKTIKTWLRKPNVQAIRYAYYPANASYTDVIEIYTKRKL